MNKVYIVMLEFYDGLDEYGSGIHSEFGKVFSSKDKALLYCREEAEKLFARKKSSKVYNKHIDSFAISNGDNYYKVSHYIKGYRSGSFINAAFGNLEPNDERYVEGSVTYYIREEEVE